MNLSTDAKFVIGVFVATVLVIVAGAYLTNMRATPAPAAQVSDSLKDRLVREDSASVGPQDAKVTVVEFGDFQCPACGALHPQLKSVMEKYKDASVRFVFRNYPLPQHQFAALAAEAALAAKAQNKFWEFHDVMFEKQLNLAQSDLESYAKDLGLDVEKFTNDLNSHTYKNVVEKDLADGNALNLRQTPTIFINGTTYTGNYSVAQLSEAIDKALQ